MNKRKIGNAGEDLACRHLINAGCFIRSRNYYTRHGELDIVFTDGDYLVFCEVKYRKDDSFGNALEAISYNKQKRIINAARVYMMLENIQESTPVRFDCIGITGADINWVKNAF